MAAEAHAPRTALKERRLHADTLYMDFPQPPDQSVRTSSQMGFLALEELVPGGIYRIKSRNLRFGVWMPDAMKGTGGFSGIREKFYGRSLFTEYHHDTGGSFGTAHAIEKVAQLPADIELVERFSVCRVCRQPDDFVRENEDAPTGSWHHKVRALDADHEVDPVSMQNEAIWDALEAIEITEAKRLRAAGELWSGPGHMKFLLSDAPVPGSSPRIVQVGNMTITVHDEDSGADISWREATADEYFDAQEAAGVCMGVHHFTADGVAGRVSFRN